MATRNLPPDPDRQTPAPGTPVVYLPKDYPAALARELLYADRPTSPTPVGDASGPAKTIFIVLESAPDRRSKATVEPGATAGQVLASVNLGKGYTLKSPRTGDYLAEDQDLYPLVEDGQEVRATPAFPSATLLEGIKGLLSGKPTQESEEEWLRRAGWKKVGNAYDGFFRMGQAAPVRGRIDLTTGRPQVYFWQLSAVFAPHVCVEKKGDTGWYWLHPAEPLTTTSLREVVPAVELWLQTLVNPKLWKRGVA